MPTANLVSAALTSGNAAAVIAAIQTIRTNLPFLRNLTPEERHDLAKMGPKSVPFVSQTLLTAKANPTMLPASFDLPGFDADLALYQALGPITTQLTQLSELYNDTVLALSSDLYSEALDAYSYLKAGNGAAGLDNLKSMMSQRFLKRPAKTEAAEPVTAQS